MLKILLCHIQLNLKMHLLKYYERNQCMDSFENVLRVAKLALVDEGSRNHNAAIARTAIASLLTAVLLLSIPGHFVQCLVFLCQVRTLLACFGQHPPNAVLSAILSRGIGGVCRDCFVELLLSLVERRHTSPPVYPILVAELFGFPLNDGCINFVHVLVFSVDISAWLQQLVDVHDPDFILDPVHEQFLHTIKLCVEFQHAHHLYFIQGLVQLVCQDIFGGHEEVLDGLDPFSCALPIEGQHFQHFFHAGQVYDILHVEGIVLVNRELDALDEILDQVVLVLRGLGEIDLAPEEARQDVGVQVEQNATVQAVIISVQTSLGNVDHLHQVLSIHCFWSFLYLRLYSLYSFALRLPNSIIETLSCLQVPIDS